LNKPSCKKTVPSKLCSLLLINPIHFLNRVRLHRQIQNLRSSHLHPKSEFVRLDSCLQLGVTSLSSGMALVHPVHEIELPSTITHRIHFRQFRKWNSPGVIQNRALKVRRKKS